jgi:hypothetical protein
VFRRLAAAAIIFTLTFIMAACSSNASNSGKEPAPSKEAVASNETATGKEDTLSKDQAYIAARLAEEKVDGLFHQETSADNKPILNPVTPDKDSAVKFLNAYMDSALTEKIVSHYLTEEKANNAIVVKNEKYISSSIRDTSTKDGGVFTVKKNNEDKYILFDFVKK